MMPGMADKNTAAEICERKRQGDGLHYVRDIKDRGCHGLEESVPIGGGLDGNRR